MEDFKIKCTDIPIGYWDTYGNWFPNLTMKMSVEDQFKHNLEGGHFNKVLKILEVKEACHATVFAEDSRDTKGFWHKLLKFFV